MSIMIAMNTAMKALETYSLAIDTTQHNIANIGTEGYSRQLANISATAALSLVGQAGQIGTGSQLSSIERIRDLFLDNQIMTEEQNVGYWTE